MRDLGEGTSGGDAGRGRASHDEDRHERNPFTLPSDEEVFRLRDEERRRHALARDAQQHLRVWQKTTSQTAPSGAVRLKELIGNTGGAIVMSKQARRTAEMVSEARSLVANERRQEKEKMAEFIAKKREMFLVQMSLDTKREEIRKLEEKAQMKEEALKKSEQMLEEDAIRFDTFLKENDKKAHEAIKKAERETKLKTDKVQEIKRLNQQIQMVSSDMSKHKEALEDCLKYKEFLDALTPDEWFVEQQAAKKSRQAARREARMAARRDDAEKARDAAELERQRRADDEDHGKGKKKKSRRRPSHTDNPSSEPARAATAKPLLDAFDDEPCESSDEELPMYFRQPTQLLDIFTQLEEQNLFLIQNSQETEQALEELKQHFESTKREMDGKTALLQQNIDDLEGAISAEEAKAQLLRNRLEARAGATQGRQETLLAALHDKVRDVYARCNFDVGSKPGTLLMLSELEDKLEKLLDHVETMPEDYILKEEKDKEKKRRERKRQEQQTLQDAQQEERNRKSIARSMQAPKKRTGRQVMFRSKPESRAVLQEATEEEDDGDELKYLT
ncbi:hypothetical protein M885DRAFT_582800 [Pelagophyceae sp. CCMP2097]|nr:hypothetical protein M885DRAFT_582800 [Pelagophyceae sp. CCMP2097]|mmetsp:Transcript_9864/g.34065  ORF Transcript_9864/g.34065 Transcript_9864/m.34065 type:complete len:562 (+) Transcript_9864:56-1741(+)